MGKHCPKKGTKIEGRQHGHSKLPVFMTFHAWHGREKRRKKEKSKKKNHHHHQKIRKVNLLGQMPGTNAYPGRAVWGYIFTNSTPTHHQANPRLKQPTPSNVTHRRLGMCQTDVSFLCTVLAISSLLFIINGNHASQAIGSHQSWSHSLLASQEKETATQQQYA